MAEKTSLTLEDLEAKRQSLSEVLVQMQGQITNFENQLAGTRNNFAANSGALQQLDLLIQELGGEPLGAQQQVPAPQSEEEIEEVNEDEPSKKTAAKKKTASAKKVEPEDVDLSEEAEDL